jgi:hypothetical protein
MYTFQAQFKKGQAVELRVIQMLEGLGKPLKLAEMVDQRRGIDCFVGEYSLEIKSDFKAEQTRNFYLEIELPKDKLGWVISCQADRLVLVCGDNLLFTTPDYLRSKIEHWKSIYPIKTCHNANGYWSKGVLVPCKEVNGESLSWGESLVRLSKIFDVGFNPKLAKCYQY